jgi:GLPGLI family protein
MKYIKGILVVLVMMLLITVNSRAQNYNGEVTYAIVPNFTAKTIDKEKNGKELDAETKKSREMISLMMNAAMEESDVAIVLRFNGRESIVQPIEALNNEATVIDFAAITAKSMGVIYTDYNTMSTLMVDDSFGDRLIVPDSLNRFRWELTNERKEIGGYQCLKATGVKFNYEDEGIEEVPITAWYTPEIPIPTGPAGYGGLPGLILELNIRNWKSIRAYEVKLKNKEVKINKPIKGKWLTRAEYEKLFEGY